VASVRAGEGQAVTLTHAASERANAVRVLAQKALVSIRKQDMARAIERVAEQGFMGPTGVVLILTAERLAKLRSRRRCRRCPGAAPFERRLRKWSARFRKLWTSAMREPSLYAGRTWASAMTSMLAN